jgi:signal transduction histidine kinase
MLETIGAQAYRIRDMIGDAMLFARPPQPKPIGLKLAEVLEEVIGKFRAEADERRIALHLDVAPDVGILADPVQLRIVISSLLRNSFEAVSEGASIAVESSSATHDGRRFARLVVRDSGRGFSEQDREHLFDPFFSGRQAGRGLGFGLSKCWRIVTLHGGEILAAAPETGGAEFTVLWPGE